jgi:hypothetical protein
MWPHHLVPEFCYRVEFWGPQSWDIECPYEEPTLLLTNFLTLRKRSLSWSKYASSEAVYLPAWSRWVQSRCRFLKSDVHRSTVHSDKPHVYPNALVSSLFFQKTQRTSWEEHQIWCMIAVLDRWYMRLILNFPPLVQLWKTKCTHKQRNYTNFLRRIYHFNTRGS